VGARFGSLACKLPKRGSVRILRGFRVGAVFGSLPCKLPKPGSARILRGSAQTELVKEHGPEIDFRKADPNKSVSFTKWTIWRPKRSKPDPWPFWVSATRILRGFRVGAGFGSLACKLPKPGSARIYEVFARGPGLGLLHASCLNPAQPWKPGQLTTRTWPRIHVTSCFLMRRIHWTPKGPSVNTNQHKNINTRKQGNHSAAISIHIWLYLNADRDLSSKYARSTLRKNII